MEVHILRRVEEDPGSSVQRIAVAEGISVKLVWRTNHEQSLYCNRTTAMHYIEG
jgi:hypothetical protein